MANVFGYKHDPTVRTGSDGSVSPWVTKDRDANDLLQRVGVKFSSGDVDLRPYCTDSTQFSLSACAGNACADAVEIINAIEEKNRAQQEWRSPRPVDQLSRLFVYSMARTLMGDLAKDDGTYIRACFEVLSRFGICKETTWPYLEAKVYLSPSLLAQREALGHKIHSYYRIKGSGQDRLDAIEGALRSGHPVVFGTDVTHAFMSLRGAGPVDRPTSATAGAHAMIVVGILGNHFLVKNSWGRGWGDSGFCLMTPEYLTWEETMDLWVPTLGSDFA